MHLVLKDPSQKSSPLLLLLNIEHGRHPLNEHQLPEREQEHCEVGEQNEGHGQVEVEVEGRAAAQPAPPLAKLGPVLDGHPLRQVQRGGRQGGHQGGRPRVHGVLEVLPGATWI